MIKQTIYSYFEQRAIYNINNFQYFFLDFKTIIIKYHLKLN